MFQKAHLPESKQALGKPLIQTTTPYESVQQAFENTRPEMIRQPIIDPKRDPVRRMHAAAWWSTNNVQLVTVGVPLVTEPRDAVIKVTLSSICGSDLHLLHNELPMKRGDILGHECVGIVEDVGVQVKNLKKGDKVVVSATISCGECEFCRKGSFSACEHTNPNKNVEKLYGDRGAAVFGHPDTQGGFDGSQAQYLRVPIADVNCLVVPHDIEDQKVLFLSDIACTGWQANDLAKVKSGDIVAIWGCGPVGLMTAMWAVYRKASRVIVIDHYEYRLKKARQFGCETINGSQVNALQTLRHLTRENHGPDICIEAVGFRFPSSLLHKFERATFMESDSPQILNECLMSCKKGGIVCVVGEYIAYANHFHIGALMQKNITLIGAGPVSVQAYWKHLFSLIVSGQIDPSFLVTHIFPLSEISQAYQMFDHKDDDCIKILIDPWK